MSRNGENGRERYARWRIRRRVRKALALNRRGEVRADGLLLKCFDNRLEIEWFARDVHPWDRDLPACEKARLFAEQCLEDANAAIERLFCELSEIDVIQFKVIDPKSFSSILSGIVTRNAARAADATSAGMKLKQLGVRFRLVDWHFEPLR